MNTRHLFILFIVCLATIILAFNNPNNVSKAENSKENLAIKIEKRLINLENARYKKRLNHLKQAMIVYNPNITDSTVETFLNAIESFGLDRTDKMLNWSIYQILLESRGIHKVDGKLISSVSNAKGIAQIKPSTAFHYLRIEMNEQELENIYSLGASKIKFNNTDKVQKGLTADGKTTWITPNKTLKKVEKWMQSEKNCILLWAHIMSYNTNKYGFEDALVIYNVGKSSWKVFRENSLVNQHSYILGIKRVENYLKQKRQL